MYTSARSAPPPVPPDPGLPRPALVYLAHTAGGVSMRALSRRLGVHPSTIHRQVRRVEERRDDPLFDEAMTGLDRSVRSRSPVTPAPEVPTMSLPRPATDTGDDARIEREARRILRRLCESAAFLAVAPDLDLAVVLRETVQGSRPRQIATLPRDVAREFAVRDWIACRRQGKVACYEITAAGRAALDRMLAADLDVRRAAHSFAEAPTPFQMQHRAEGVRTVMAEDGSGPVTLRVNVAESPLAWLARRAGPDGEAFLAVHELEAGERLREDFERAGLGPRVTQNWERFLTAGTHTASPAGPAGGGGEAARDRVSAALRALGPGLSDIAFRCCCFLEGLETAEKRLGWSKRSGKVVLKIALGRLADHYGLAARRAD